MKKLLLLILLSSCITVNIYESKPQEPQEPKEIKWEDWKIEDIPDFWLKSSDTLNIDTIIWKP